MNRPPFVRLLLCSTLFLIPPVLYASVALKTDANTRLRVPIARDSMNRIAFANDRISQVFGDEEAYTLQSDETRGQIFLKPTEANGDKPISITLTTEQNVVQDMELTPQKIPTRTIILKGEGKKENKSENMSSKRYLGSFGNGLGFMGQAATMPGNASSQLMNPPMDRICQLVRIIKEAASQPLGEADENKPAPLHVKGLAVEGLRTLHDKGSALSIYTLKNTTETDVEVTENSFIGSTVLAVSVEKRILKPQEVTRLFVLRSA